MARNATNKLLHQAKSSKSDEFYTQFHDIEKEASAYLQRLPDVETISGNVKFNIQSE